VDDRVCAIRARFTAVEEDEYVLETSPVHGPLAAFGASSNSGIPGPALDGVAAEREHVGDEDLRLRDRAALPDGCRALVPGGERSPLVAVEVVQQLP
jgi:hypothetical protein